MSADHLDPLRSAGDDPLLVPDELIDAFFDGDLDEQGKRRLFDGLARDPVAAEKFARTMFLVEAMRRPVETECSASAPDFAGLVLSEVDRRRRWLAPGARRLVSVGRLAAAAALLVMLGGALALRRANPDAVMLADRPAPLTTLVETSRIEARQNVRGMASALEPIRGVVANLSSARPCEPAVKTPCELQMQVARFVAPTELPAETPWRSRFNGAEATPASWTAARPAVNAHGAAWMRATVTTASGPEPIRVIVIPGG